MAISPGALRTGGVSGGKVKIRDNMRVVLAWLSFGAACLCGAAFASTMPGGWVRDITAWAGWVGLAVLAAAVVAVVSDIAADFEPNRRAVYTVMIVPALMRGVGGRFAETVGGAFGQLLAQFDQYLAAWTGEGSAWGIAVVTGIIAAGFARRHVKTHVG